MPVFAWWQELKVYFRSARISSPGKQVLPSFCGFCCRGSEEEPLRASRLFFFFSPHLLHTLPCFSPSGTFWDFLPNKAGLWFVRCSYFNLCSCSGLDYTVFTESQHNLFFLYWVSEWQRFKQRCLRILLWMCVYFNARVCVCVFFAHMYGAMPLLLLGLLFVTVIPPNEEVEWVSVLYCSHLQTPYQMPRSLHTSHKHFILIPAHRAKPGQPRSSCHFFVHSPLSVHSLQSEWAPSRPSTKCLLNYLVFFQAKGGVQHNNRERFTFSLLACFATPKYPWR